MNFIDLHRSELFLIVYHKSSQDIRAFFSFRYPFFFHIAGQTLLSDPQHRSDKLPQKTVTREKEIHVNPSSSHFTLRYPSIISVLGPQIPIIFPIFLVVPCGIWSFASKAMCLDPSRVVLILGRFQGVEALIFTVADAG